MTHPTTTKHLQGSKWSVASGIASEFRHSEVDRPVDADGNVTLIATLDTSISQVIAWRELRDRTKWEPGWV